MSSWLVAVFGLLLIFIGFRMYNYFDKNIDSINNKPGNLYGIAILVIIIGIIVTLVSIVNWIK